ncbi:MAG: hypothetical protein A2452_12270 [Candidatus Firestonebacteria bacterium RIFOXYC2_FULL_39_67]|nr:MAG: hypothetical protein A2536_07800 [Candidatus Firestonebacteria bacterium RIFOXYD2_FULL_39_29]OGF55623.1 MAG: hypothetical protein A2452_12270 [Candidatus Firestonebacteria bacterium RIFOXYC2_FULL_39_67]
MAIDNTEAIKVVCDNMDRLMSCSLRTLGHPRAAYVKKLYERERSVLGEPICYVCAKEILNHPGCRIAIVTGTYNPVYFPGGETDGPIGAVVLGRALEQLGYKITLCFEKQILPAMQALAKAAGLKKYEVEGLTIGEGNGYAELAEKYDGAIFIEKIGTNKAGVPHTSSGVRSDSDDSVIDGFVNGMLKKDKFSIGLGDGGNEIGFGKMYDYVREVVRYGAECRCPCKDGIATKLATKILFPSAISNWSAYSIIAVIALIKNDISLCHTPEKEIELLELAPKVGCFEGTVGKGKAYIDAVPARGSAAMVELLRTAVEVAYGETISLESRLY